MIGLYISLFLSFVKVGFLGFGGGYAIVTLLQQELAGHGWLSAAEFADLVAVSQMTPGPLAVNAATYIGGRLAGLSGAVVATFGVSIPSFILVILVARFFRQFNRHPLTGSVMGVLRPATAGLIASAVLMFAELSVFTAPIPFSRVWDLLAGRATGTGTGMDTAALAGSGFGIDPGAMLIALLAGIGILRFRIHPVWIVLLSGVLGIFLC